MRLLSSLPFQLLFVSFFLAIITGTMAKETDKSHRLQATDGQVGETISKFPITKRKSAVLPPSTHLLISTVPQGTGVWHDLWNTGKTVTLDKRAETKNVTQAIDGEADSKLPTIKRKNIAHYLRLPNALMSYHSRSKERLLARSLVRRQDSLCLSKTATVPKNITQAVNAKPISKPPKIPCKNVEHHLYVPNALIFIHSRSTKRFLARHPLVELVGQDQSCRQERRHRNQIRDANGDCHGGQD